MPLTQRRVVMLLGYFKLAFITLSLPTVAYAQACENWAAKAVSLQGNIEFQTLANTTNKHPSWLPVRADTTFCQGSMLRVGSNSRATVLLSNDTLLRLDQNTTVTFTDLQANQTSQLDLIKGIVHFISRVKQAFKVATPFVNASVDGTEFVVAVSEAQQLTEITVFEGRVTASNTQGQLALSNNQSARILAQQPPERIQRIQPRDAVQWALYYPSLLQFDASALAPQASAPWQEAIKDAIALYRQAKFDEALTRLTAIDEAGITEAQFYNYRATLALNVGRVELAQADLTKALQLEKNNADALALNALIAVVQNDKVRAMTYAQQALQADAQSASAHLAHSYVQQAHFDLEQARHAAQLATTHAPDNALAWARLAELQLMFRELDNARAAADKAVALDATLAHSQTVLGFAELLRLSATKAKLAFDRAIKLDQAAPLPRLGKGLALIRQGQLTEGRREIEIAASLDPNHALIRSYLGKAYYEEHRDQLAADQYTMAKALDPLDPTPWLYDALRKQANNQPIAALQDLETSSALNDNRAVYRSRLLLDEDQAAKSANQARIYQDLGFEHLARLESSRSLNLAPANHAAHRLLASTYVGLPRHEIARVSELLQAQMLQPISVAPISAGAAETNLFNFEGTGPSAAYNEYASLFDRNRLTLQASGIYGSNNTRGEDIAAAGLFNRFALSAGHFNHRSDGVRENNDSDKTINNIFGQFRLSSKLSLQAEYRDKEQEQGDMRMRFDPESFNKDLRRTADEENWRLGLRYEYQPGHTFLLAVNEGELDDMTFASEFLTLGTQSETQQYEAQYLWQATRWRGTAGMGYLESDELLSTIATLPFPFPSPPPQLTIRDIEQHNVYFYNYLTVANATLTLAASYDDIDQKNGINQDQFNPKVGFTLDIHPYTIFRAAAFRTQRRELTLNQTLEPTQIAGFNQLFDDQLGTEAWRYGLGLDQKFGSDVRTGIEFTKRDITRVFTTPEVREEDQKESAHRAYLHWSVNNHTALSSEYHFEDFERSFVPGEENDDSPASLTTQQLPIAVSFFRSNGIYTRLRTTYVDQKITYVLSPSGTKTLNNNFLIVDLSLGYSLPKHLGKIELTARNLGDKEFNYHSVDPGPGTDLPLPYYPESAYFMTLQSKF